MRPNPHGGGDGPGPGAGGTGAGPGATMAVAGCFYTLLVAAALVWLSLRDRLPSIADAAIGDHGPLAAAGGGLILGLVGAWLLATASRRFASVRICESKIAGVLGAVTDRQVLVLATSSAIAEELFFRHAVQDALGPFAAVAFYVMLNTGPGFWVWTLVALVAGTVFSALVHLGLGLLSATTAHAIVNYLTLRRLVSP